MYCRACISNYFIQPIRDALSLTDEEVNAGCRSCPMCRKTLHAGQVFRCAAIFRPQASTTPDVEDDDGDIKPDAKPDIGSDRKGKKRARSTAESFFGSLKPDEDEGEDEQPGNKRKRTDNGKGKARATASDDDSDGDDVEEIAENIPPSTKMRHLLELIQGYLEEDPNTKILVFSGVFSSFQR